MFAENESESPRAPSPWDSFIATPPSQSPTIGGIPRLVAESDDGNIEYKLQLLSPSPGRFQRLVTQMKWRLLEGGGEAYYELGVADSGLLVGLPRVELERSLETLEMMAGEIGASVIVVKEIEVPAAMLDLADPDTLDALNGKRPGRRQPLLLTSDESTATNTETETELSATDVEEGPARKAPFDIFSMDDLDSDAELAVAQVPTFDLEIANVYKPRPIRERSTAHVGLAGKKNRQKGKKGKAQQLTESLANANTAALSHESDGVKAIKAHKAQSRRGARDRRREERRQVLAEEAATAITQNDDKDTACDALVHNLEELHVSVDPEPLPTLQVVPAPDEPVVDPELDDFDGEDDVFPSPITALPGPFTGLASSHLTVPSTSTTSANNTNSTANGTRLIVEALVVRKMSIEEAFLDFGGAFSLS